jgi:hypothetical protein
VLVLVSLLPDRAAAQADSAEGPAPYRNRLLVLPYVTYAPQTGAEFGVAGGWQFKWPGAGRDSATRSSYLAGNLAYTTKGQWAISAEGSAYAPANRWWLFSRASVAFFPLFYYGIGPRTERADTNLMEHRLIHLETKVLRRLTGNLFAGVYYRLFSVFDLDWQFPARIPAGLPGGTGGVSSGLGISVQVDARNSVTTPTRGHYLLLDYLRHDPALGSDFGYDHLVAEGRVYLPVRRGRDVVALTAYSQFNGRDVPIQAMAMISNMGSQLVSRGVYLGRFRDRHELVAQAEYRGHLKGRFGYVVFGSAGNVFGSPGNDLMDDVKLTYGAGLRFDVNPRDPLNLRLDFTLTDFGESGVSLGAAEAF